MILGKIGKIQVKFYHSLSALIFSFGSTLLTHCHKTNKERYKMKTDAGYTPTENFRMGRIIHNMERCAVD
jgi:hypothetical protein